MPDPLEKRALKLGYIALTDAAPLLVAAAKGCFARHGLSVELSQEPSWANIRDKVCFGALDGAHMLAGIPIACSLGLGPIRQDMLTGFGFGLNGNAVTLSHAVCDEIGGWDGPSLDAARLRPVIERRRALGAPPLTLAHVYEFSNHNYQLRYWLAAGGIDPVRDVRLCVIPPVQMVASLEQGEIDGFCVGEPWNSLAVRAGLGCVATTGYAIWNNAVEKVLGVTREWAERHPATHLALIRALIEATLWLDDPANLEEAETLLRTALQLDAAGPLLRAQGWSVLPPVFGHYAASFPWSSEAEFILVQMLRWGQITRPLALRETAAAIFQPRWFRNAAAALDFSAPLADSKTKGEHSGEWSLPGTRGPIVMGADRLLDGRIFDPGDALAFLRADTIAHRRVEDAALAELNRVG